MHDMNRVTLSGNLTSEPAIRGQNRGIMAMRLAVTTRDRTVDGDYTEKPNYFDVVLRGARRIEALEKMIGKGSRIAVDGHLEWREWESEGGKRQGVEVVADDLFLLDPPRKAQSGGGDDFDF